MNRLTNYNIVISVLNGNSRYTLFYKEYNKTAKIQLFDCIKRNYQKITTANLQISKYICLWRKITLFRWSLMISRRNIHYARRTNFEMGGLQHYFPPLTILRDITPLKPYYIIVYFALPHSHNKWMKRCVFQVHNINPYLSPKCGWKKGGGVG